MLDPATPAYPPLRWKSLAREPFVVCWNHIPRRVFRRRRTDHLFVRLLIVIPILAFVYVAGGKLPILLRLIQSRQKALLLLLLRDIQKELADHRPTPRHVPLKAADILEPFLPQMLPQQRLRNALVLQQLRVHAHY